MSITNESFPSDELLSQITNEPIIVLDSLTKDERRKLLNSIDTEKNLLKWAEELRDFPKDKRDTIAYVILREKYGNHLMRFCNYHVVKNK